jgi:hypothetical protein
MAHRASWLGYLALTAAVMGTTGTAIGLWVKVAPVLADEEPVLTQQNTAPGATPATNLPSVAPAPGTPAATSPGQTPPVNPAADPTAPTAVPGKPDVTSPVAPGGTPVKPVPEKRPRAAPERKPGTPSKPATPTSPNTSPTPAIS